MVNPRVHGHPPTTSASAAVSHQKRIDLRWAEGWVARRSFW